MNEELDGLQFIPLQEAEEEELAEVLSTGHGRCSSQRQWVAPTRAGVRGCQLHSKRGSRARREGIQSPTQTGPKVSQRWREELPPRSRYLRTLEVPGLGGPPMLVTLSYPVFAEQDSVRNS